MAVQNSLAKNKKVGLTAYLTGDAVKAQISKVVGGKNGDQFVSSVIAAVQQNPQLKECSNPSILSAALQGHALKLSPSPQLGQYYMVPFKDKRRGTTEAQFQLGYKGYVQLAIRSGYYKKLNVLAIKEGELIRYDPLNEDIEVKLIDDEEARENAPTIGYYAMFEYLNGFRKTMYWSRNKMLLHADRYSQAFSKDGCDIQTRYGKKHKVSFEEYEAGNFPQNDAWMYSSFWYKDFDGMAYKTMLRQLISKWGIMSIEMVDAMDRDMTVVNEDGTVDYVETDEAAAEPAVEAEYQEVQAAPEPAPQADAEQSQQQSFDGLQWGS